MNLADLLKRRREAMRLSIREAARQLKMGYAYLSNVEAGKLTGMNISTLRRLQRFYGISDATLWSAARETIDSDPT